MIRITQRRRLLGGAFCIVTVSWVIDLLTGQPNPDSAKATSTSAAIGAAQVAMPPDPEDLEALMASLRADPGDADDLNFDAVSRDLFVPTAWMEAALSSRLPDPTEAGTPEQAATQAPFVARHVLQGTLMGRVPLALIDDVLYPRGAAIDDYRIIEIQRDFVILRRGQSRVTLRVVPVEDR